MFPERLECEVTADGLPLEGALVDVSLSMTAKNPHTMVLGPADKAGKIVVSGAEMLAHARRNCRHFVMDYADPAAHFAGSLDVKPVTPDRVQRMKEAYREFNRYLDYPQAWDRTLDDLAGWFARHQVSTLAVTATATPAAIRVTAVEVQL